MDERGGRSGLRSGGDMRPGSEEYEAYLESDEWKRRAMACYRRAGHRCELCYSRGPLHAHHRTYRRLGSEHVSDLTALCDRCHEHFHEVPRTGERDSRDGVAAEFLPDGSYVEYERVLEDGRGDQCGRMKARIRLEQAKRNMAPGDDDGSK